MNSIITRANKVSIYWFGFLLPGILRVKKNDMSSRRILRHEINTSETN